jgi:hypothetical protein
VLLEFVVLFKIEVCLDLEEMKGEGGRDSGSSLIPALTNLSTAKMFAKPVIEFEYNFLEVPWDSVLSL